MRAIALGGSIQAIGENLGVEPSEIQGIIDEVDAQDQLFSKGVTLIRIDIAGGIVDRDFGWADLERLTLEKLRRVIVNVKDPDVLTRIATAANRAKKSTDPVVENRPNVSNTLVLAGGDLGVLQLDLSPRIAKQLAAPRSVPGESQTAQIERVALKDIRAAVDPPRNQEQKNSEVQPLDGEILGPDKKPRIQIDKGDVAEFVAAFMGK